MAKYELLQFLADSAGDLIAKAEAAPTPDAEVYLDEAEELLALGGMILGRARSDRQITQEAA